MWEVALRDTCDTAKTCWATAEAREPARKSDLQSKIALQMVMWQSEYHMDSAATASSRQSSQAMKDFRTMTYIKRRHGMITAGCRHFRIAVDRVNIHKRVFPS